MVKRQGRQYVTSLTAASVQRSLPAGLKKLLKKHAQGDTLAVLDSKLGSIVKDKLQIDCVYK